MTHSSPTGTRLAPWPHSDLTRAELEDIAGDTTPDAAPPKPRTEPARRPCAMPDPDKFETDLRRLVAAMRERGER